MPSSCRPEDFAQGPEPSNPVTPTNRTGNYGGSHDEPDAERPVTASNDGEEAEPLLGQPT